MKYLLLLFTLLFSLEIQAQEGDIYVFDFDVKAIDEQNNLGRSIANDFEKILSTCKNRYHLVSRAHARPLLGNGNSDEEKMETLGELGVDYMLSGSVSIENESYVVEYTIEELATWQTISLETIKFPSERKLLDNDFRYLKIKAKLAEHENLCKKFTTDKTIEKKPDTPIQTVVITKHKPKAADTDGDGVPDALDYEINSPKGAIVNAYGISIQEDGVEIDSLITPKDKLKESFPSLPAIYFEEAMSIKDVDHVKLHQVASLIKRYPTIKMEVIGTDKTDENKAAERSKLIINYFVENYKFSPKQFVLKQRLDDKAQGMVLFEVSEEEMDWSDF